MSMATGMVGSFNYELCGEAMRSYQVANCGWRSRGAPPAIASHQSAQSAQPISGGQCTRTDNCNIVARNDACSSMLCHVTRSLSTFLLIHLCTFVLHGHPIHTVVSSHRFMNPPVLHSALLLRWGCRHIFQYFFLLLSSCFGLFCFVGHFLLLHLRCPSFLKQTSSF